MSGATSLGTHVTGTARPGDNESDRGTEDRRLEGEYRNHAPRVSVGLPVFNGETFLEQALDSLLDQTFEDFEIVISDNGSVDRTEEICRLYVARDRRIRYYRNEVNRGCAWNHNRVVDLAKGEFFKWHAADDYCAPEFLARCVVELDQDPAAVMAITRIEEVDERGTPLPSVTVADQTLLPVVPPGAPVHVRFRQNIRLDHLCLACYGLIRLRTLRQAGPMGSYTDADRDFVARLALYGHCAIVSETLLFNRDHPGRFGRSYNRLYHGWTEQVGWWDPGNAKRRVFPPTWKKLFELTRAVHRAPLTQTDRLNCYREIAGCLRDRRILRRLYFDTTHYPRKWVVRHFPAAKRFWNWVWDKKSGVDKNGSAPCREATQRDARY